MLFLEVSFRRTHAVHNPWETDRDVLDRKENLTSLLPVEEASVHDYSVNDLGQRDSVDVSGDAFSGGQRDRSWAYDKFGQLVSEADANDTNLDRGFAYDDNQYVSEHLDTAGTIVAHYEYEAFGNVINYTEATSGQASSFRHRFSTKQQDDESGLLYYGYRYMDPLTGRWPSRDPIGERGGENLGTQKQKRAGQQSKLSQNA